MKKIKVISVRLKSFEPISDKCFKAIDFNGNEELIPASQFYGSDNEITKSEAVWLSEWILKQKNITFSDKKSAWIIDGKLKKVSISVHVPKKIEPQSPNIDDSLLR